MNRRGQRFGIREPRRQSRLDGPFREPELKVDRGVPGLLALLSEDVPQLPAPACGLQRVLERLLRLPLTEEHRGGRAGYPVPDGAPHVPLGRIPPRRLRREHEEDQPECLLARGL